MELKIHRGDVFYIRDSGYYVGSEMAKTRPAVIVSNEKTISIHLWSRSFT